MLNNTLSFILILILFTTIFIINYIYLTYIKNDTTLNENINKNELMNNTMASILLVFGGLKLFDLQKFSNIFAKYNLISKQIPYYSYFYPFIEIILAIALFSRYNLNIVYGLIIILMIISLISVSISLYQGQNLRCGCLGSFFHMPLSYVTISENVVMLVMSFYQLR
jgi:hypothetical protein|tara:strand:+ start:989 stop:1489 length:501 start_codon:yes stop_codon:yes gene_type:complete